MYSINCNHYQKQFKSIELLLQDVIDSGQDPNYEITHNGKRTGEMLNDLIQY